MKDLVAAGIKSVGAVVLVLYSLASYSSDDSQRTLFTHVNVFDGVNETLKTNMHVLVEGQLIKAISSKPIDVKAATVIDGQGKTLMPGLIDAHVHLHVTMLSGGIKEYESMT